MLCVQWHLCEGLNIARFTVSFFFPLVRKIVEDYVRQSDVNGMPVVMPDYKGKDFVIVWY